MNNIKLSLEQFLIKKNECQKILNNINQLYEKESEHSKYDLEQMELKYINMYLEVQKDLLSYDLSDIPFEAWKDFEIASDKTQIADFSKTKANIDFNIINYSPYVNFKGCNIRNLDKINMVLNPKYFDEQTIKNNPSLFLSDSFSEEFKEKYYKGTITLDDLIGFNLEQMEELKKKNIQIQDQISRNTLTLLGLDKVLELYKHSKEEYFVINDILEMVSYTIYSSKVDEENFIEDIRNAKVSELKSICYSYLRTDILTKKHSILKPSNYPKLFVEENDDIFLNNANIPDEVRKRYYNRELTIKDLVEYLDVFNIPIDYFLRNNYFLEKVVNDYGIGTFQKLVKKYPDVFKYLENYDSYLYDFSEFFVPSDNLEESLKKAVKKFFLSTESNLILGSDGSLNYVPEWISSMNFIFTDKITTVEQLMNCNSSTVIFDEKQQSVIDMLNIENIKRFESETGFFSHKKYEYSNELEIFDVFVSYFYDNQKRLFSQIDFGNGSLSYEDFLKEFAKCLDIMRKNNLFNDIQNYDYITGEFRDKYPQIFIDMDAPKELKLAFYNNRITPNFIFNNKDYIFYLVDKNLLNTINANIKLNTIGLVGKDGTSLVSTTNFIDEYVSRYGNEKFLQLLAKYGKILSDIKIDSFNNEIEDENLIEKSLRKSIYNEILKSNIDYSYLEGNSVFVSEYPDIFVDFDKLTNIDESERLRLKNAFYNRNLTFDDIKLYPELATILKDKNLNRCFDKGSISQSKSFLDPIYTEMLLLDVFGNEKFLELCSKYGKHINNIISPILKEFSLSSNDKFYKYENSKRIEATYEEIVLLIEDIITSQCLEGIRHYTEEDAPDFLKEKYPQLFLEPDAPENLKKYFYSANYSQALTFSVLKKHKEWLPYLKGKQISIQLIRQAYSKSDMLRFFKLFGEDKALMLGISRAETVDQMINSHQVDLMKSWYDKTGQKFIPDFVVMQNFTLEEADKFLISGSNWSNLMRIKNFSSSLESREAMLKLAYSFGAFDQDQRGYKKLLELLTGLPKRVGEDKGGTLAIIAAFIDNITNRRAYFNINNGDVIRSRAMGQKEYVNTNLSLKQKEDAYSLMINYLKDNETIQDENRKIAIKLIDSIKKEMPEFNFATENILSNIYKKNDDGSYTLTINPQNCPKTCEALMTIFQSFESMPVLTPDKAHKLFGGFSLKYDPEFREFLLSNIDEIYEHPEYSTYIASIQKQFSKIKAVNSNRTLTLALAISYVQNNKYEGVEVGNERAAEISAIAGYTQSDFNILQQIYNYGKQRTFSSIPRIEKTSGKYTYEILRLDDPLAMAIGTLTDCCQEIGNAAEVCMEHSMVDKNGRVFVIKDEEGNIVAQSWVWRNKDVLCFDNIEIPNKAFSRAVKEDSRLGRTSLTNDVFNIYRQAAHDLIEKDELIYKQLLEKGEITEEQYNGLRLGKVTVGLGYNDIAATLKENTVSDQGYISRPLHFTPPVQLSRGLYTNDSNTQHILEEREDREVYDGSTLAVHSDTYIEYNDSNFSEKLLLTLEKLEIITDEINRSLKTNVKDYAEDGHFVSEISINYNLKPENTRIVMNPNFAIIYDVVDDKVRIGDFLFNTKIENENQKIDIENKVLIQIRLALQQIAKDKQIDISRLSIKKKEMYEKAMGLTDEIDIERGIGYAR